jgi:HK97 family phage major capsid protein
VTDLVRKIATWLPVTDEMLEDVSQIRSYIDSRLRLFINLAEDDQILNGNGTAPNLRGLRNRVGIASPVARSSDTNADAILKQITAITVNSFLAPDGFTIHPTNWQTIEMSKDTAGNYLGAGPFAPRLSRTLWGISAVPTVAQTLNTAFVGAYKAGAQLFRKGGVQVEASNAHADFFVKNLTAIRAEERAALAVYRPASFGEVTGLN